MKRKIEQEKLLNIPLDAADENDFTAKKNYNDSDKVTTKLNNNRSTICKHYRKGTCKYGRKGTGCLYDHPKPCKKLMRHGNKAPRGCINGGRCSDYHPRMCAMSIKKGECFAPNCQYVHVKGTKRKKETSNKTTTKPVYSNLNEKNQNHINKPKNQNHINDPNQDFLKVIHNFKIEIINTMEERIISKLLSQQIHNQIPRPTYPVRPTEYTPSSLQMTVSHYQMNQTVCFRQILGRRIYAFTSIF